MDHQDKIEVLTNMLVMSGRIDLLCSEEFNCWVTMKYFRQLNAAKSLEKWCDRPIVVASLVRRWMELDEGEDVIPTVSNLLLNVLGPDACALECSNLYYTFCPYTIDKVMWRLNAAGSSSPNELNGCSTLSCDFAKAITWHYCREKMDLCREAGVEEARLQSTMNCMENLQGQNETSLEEALEVFSLALPIATCRWGRLFDEPWLPAWREILYKASSARIRVLSLMFAYVGPTYIGSSFASSEMMDAWIQEQESKPIDKTPDAGLSLMSGPTGTLAEDDAGAYLERVFPTAKAWLDLDIPRESFGPEDPTRFQYVEDLLCNPNVKQIYDALDIVEWPAVDFSDSL